MTNNSIDPELFERIKKKLDKEKSAAYAEISAVADQYNVPKGVAAIKLASSLGLSISKYADATYYSYFKTPIGSAPGPVMAPVRTRVKVVTKPRLVNIDTTKIRNKDLQQIIHRDIAELNSAIEFGVERTSKICMIMSGSIAEALLLERLTRTSEIRRTAIAVAQNLQQDRPKQPSDPLSWALFDLVVVAQNFSPPILPHDSIPQIGQLRHWRNLIHPGREVKETITKRITATSTRARNAIGFLEFIAEYTHK